jgi:hypothetical protein
MLNPKYRSIIIKKPKNVKCKRCNEQRNNHIANANKKTGYNILLLVYCLLAYSGDYCLHHYAKQHQWCGIKVYVWGFIDKLHQGGIA